MDQFLSTELNFAFFQVPNTEQILVLNSNCMNVSCPTQSSMCLRKADEYYSILSINCIKHWWFFIDVLFLLLEHHERFMLIVLAVCLQRSSLCLTVSGSLDTASWQKWTSASRNYHTVLCNLFCELCLVILEAITLQFLP